MRNDHNSARRVRLKVTLHGPFINFKAAGFMIGGSGEEENRGVVTAERNRGPEVGCVAGFAQDGEDIASMTRDVCVCFDGLALLSMERKCESPRTFPED